MTRPALRWVVLRVLLCSAFCSAFCWDGIPRCRVVRESVQACCGAVRGTPTRAVSGSQGAWGAALPRALTPSSLSSWLGAVGRRPRGRTPRSWLGCRWGKGCRVQSKVAAEDQAVAAWHARVFAHVCMARACLCASVYGTRVSLRICVWHARVFAHLCMGVWACPCRCGCDGVRGRATGASSHPSIFPTICSGPMPQSLMLEGLFEIYFRVLKTAAAVGLAGPGADGAAAADAPGGGGGPLAEDAEGGGGGQVG